MRKKINTKWELKGTLPHIPIGKKTGRSESKYYITNPIDAKVPGGIHYDLFKRGYIHNPYIDFNSRFCEWTESRWWLYETDVEVEVSRAKRRYIVFDGLDYKCEIFINNKSVMTHENMFTPCCIDISEYEEEKLNLKVLFKSIPDELGQYGATSETFTQKSRFGYGWDFGVRLVNIGIWKNVWIEYIQDARLSDVNINTDYDGKCGLVDAEFSFEGNVRGDVSAHLISPDGEVLMSRTKEMAEIVKFHFDVENPELWYPNGMGEQPLYTLKLSFCGEENEYRLGIRSLRYKNNPGSREDAIPYTIVINGKSVYIRGNNKVPFDHLYGNVDVETLKWYVGAMKNENVNMVRVWGGGIIETEEFYDLCDEYGIMIWQDFIQSSSGIENVPSQKEEFLEKAKETAICAVKEKRNHTCLTIWCGGNELTDENDKPVTCDDKNINMLKGVVSAYDPQRLFLPSTPSGPVYRAEFDSPYNEDVHGPWEYDFETHYKNYNNMKLLLHSEFGVSGPSENYKKFLSVNQMQNEEWNVNKHHGEYWWQSYKRDSKIFGEFESVDQYIPYGQWIQAEGIRYVIENERRKAPKVSGSMVWQLNEPWPNSDNTSILDYFGNPKMVYYWIKKAFSDCDVSLLYDSLSFKDNLKVTVCKSGDCDFCDEKVNVGIYEISGKEVKQFELSTGNLPFEISENLSDEGEMYMVRVSFRGTDKDYFFSHTEKTPYAPAKDFPKCSVSFEVKEEAKDGDCMHYRAKVENTGNTPAYFVRPKDANGEWAILANDAYFTLLPGQKKEVSLVARKNLGLFFDKTKEAPDIVFECING